MRWLSDFLRYRRNEMSGQERNTFEKELQKDPFAEEASEGFDTLSPSEVTRDMLNLQQLLRQKIGRKKRNMVYRVAASIAVLMVISSVFVIIDKNKPERKLSEVAVQSNPPETVENKTLKEPVVAHESPARPPAGVLQKSKKTPDNPVESKSVETTRKVEAEKPAKMEAKDQIPENKVRTGEGLVPERKAALAAHAAFTTKVTQGIMARGIVSSSEDNMPVPGAIISIKGTNNHVITDTGGNFAIALPDTGNRTLIASFIGMEPKEITAKSDTRLEVKLDPSVSGLSEVVVVGYGSRRSDTEEQEISGGYAPPVPVIGKSAYNRYITGNIKRPDSASSGQRVVVVISFVVHTSGTLDSIRIVRSPGKPFSDEAIRLVKSGPAWKPAEENGKAIEDDVRIRIIFR